MPTRASPAKTGKPTKPRQSPTSRKRPRPPKSTPSASEPSRQSGDRKVPAPFAFRARALPRSCRGSKPADPNLQRLQTRIFPSTSRPNSSPNKIPALRRPPLTLRPPHFRSRVLTRLAWPLQTAAEGVSWRLAEGPGRNGKDRKPWTRQNEQSCGRIPAVQIAATRLTDAATVGSTSTPATEANRSAAHDAQYADQTSAAAAAVTVRDAPRHDVLRARRLEGFWRHPKGSRSTRGSKPLKEPVPVSALTSHDR